MSLKTPSRDELLEAAQAIAEAEGPKRVTQAILSAAKEIFGADFTTVWPYDEFSGKFIPRELVARGYSDEAVEEFRSIEPRPEHLTYTVLKNEVVVVEDVAKGAVDVKPDMIRTRLLNEGVKSLVGVAARAGKRRKAVIYVSYTREQQFEAPFKESLRSFSRFAGLALHKERLQALVDQTQQASRNMAGLLADHDPDRAVTRTVQRTVDALSCDSVILYVLSENEHHKIAFQSGAEVKVKVWPGVVPNEFRSLRSPAVVEDALSAGGDPAANSRAVAPLRAAGDVVGYLAVNFYGDPPHRFIKSELDAIAVHADHLAIGLFLRTSANEARLRLDERQQLFELSERFLGPISPTDVLKLGAQKGLELLRAEFCHILLPAERGDGYRIATVAGGWDSKEVGRWVPGGEGSHAGYTAQTSVVSMK